MRGQATQRIDDDGNVEVEPIGPGSMIGGYIVECLIGQGSIGSVFAGSHPVIDKQVAIKVLRPGLENNPEVRERFVREARSVNQVGHPNVVDIFDFGREGARPYLVMELLHGESLQDLLERRGKLPYEEARDILEQIAAGVDAAHAVGVIHRDLKPDNVFLSEGTDGPPKVTVLDFGVAKLEDARQCFETQAGKLLGTPLFMSPEQCRGEQVSDRADIYAFGVLAYYVLTGELPIDGESVADVLMHHLTMPPVPASTHGLPRSVDPVFAKALKKDPRQRYGTMADLAAALDRALSDDGELAGGAEHLRCVGHTGSVNDLAVSPDGALLASAGDDGSVRLWRWDGSVVGVLRGHDVRVDRVAFSPDGSLIASGDISGRVKVWHRTGAELPHDIQHDAAIVGLVFTADGRKLVSGGKDGNVSVVDTATGVSTRVAAHNGVVQALGVAPEGAVFASGGDDKVVRLWDDENGRRRGRKLHDRAVRAVEFSPDGGYLASVGLDGVLSEWRLADGKTWRHESPRGGFSCLAYSSDGRHVAASGDAGAVFVWLRPNRQPTRLVGHDRRVRSLVFSPDGSRLVSCSNDATVRVWSLETGRCDIIISHSGPARRAVFSPDGRWLATASGGTTINITRLPSPARKRTQRVRAQTASQPIVSAAPGPRLGLWALAWSVAVVAAGVATYTFW